jgi:hypothetical protein
MQDVSSGNLADFFVGIDPNQRWLILVVAISCSVGLVISLAGIVMKSISSMQRHRAETDLKREMIERGMSAEEIATVIQASPPQNASGDRWDEARRNLKSHSRL